MYVVCVCVFMYMVCVCVCVFVDVCVDKHLEPRVDEGVSQCNPLLGVHRHQLLDQVNHCQTQSMKQFICYKPVHIIYKVFLPQSLYRVSLCKEVDQDSCTKLVCLSMVKSLVQS